MTNDCFCVICFCRTYEENPEEAIKQCHILLEEPDLETAVRVGDVYGVIIEHYAREQNFSKVSDQYLKSPFYITASSSMQVMRIKELITKENYINRDKASRLRQKANGLPS